MNHFFGIWDSDSYCIRKYFDSNHDSFHGGTGFMHRHVLGLVFVYLIAKMD